MKNTDKRKRLRLAMAVLLIVYAASYLAFRFSLTAICAVEESGGMCLVFGPTAKRLESMTCVRSDLRIVGWLFWPAIKLDQGLTGRQTWVVDGEKGTPVYRY
jgi:hypothetical protein